MRSSTTKRRTRWFQSILLIQNSLHKAVVSRAVGPCEPASTCSSPSFREPIPYLRRDAARAVQGVTWDGEVGGARGKPAAAHERPAGHEEAPGRQSQEWCQEVRARDMSG
jgi:hypothetical protein